MTRLLLFLLSLPLSMEQTTSCRLRGWEMDPFTQSGDVLIGGLFLVYSGYDFSQPNFHDWPQPVSCKGDLGLLSVNGNILFVPSPANKAEGLLQFISAGTAEPAETSNQLLYLGVSYRFHIRYYRDVLGLMFAIKEINNSPGLLPNVTLGFSLLHSCMSELRAVGGALSLMSGAGNTIPHYDCHNTSVMVGIIGDMVSALSLPIARILGVHHYPQISHGASSSALSDKVNFPSFLRTVSNNVFQNVALSQLIGRFGWTWVGMLIVDNDVGEQGGRVIRAEIEKSGSCVAFAEKIHLSYSQSQILRVVDVIRGSSVNIIILHSTEAHVKSLLDAMYDEGVTGKIFISSASFTITPGLFSKKAWKVLNGTIGLMPKTGLMPEFETFLQDLHPSLYHTHPFVKPFWETAFNCTWRNGELIENMKDSGTQGPVCTQDEDLKVTIPSLFEMFDLSYTYHAYLAVYAYAHALHALLQCPSGRHDQPCGNASSVRPWKVLQSLKTTPFQAQSGDVITFDANGDISASYDIVTIQILSGHFRLVTVGSFTPGDASGHKILINSSQILWNDKFSQVPESACSQSCGPGCRRVTRLGQPTCCFDCVPCSAGEISNSTDAVECVRCPQDQWSNEERNGCVPKIIEFLSYQEPLGRVLMSIASMFSFLGLSILLTFIRFKDTPIIKATNRELSYILLTSLILCFLCCLVFIGQPSKVTCLLRQTFFSVVFSISISSVLAKTIMVILAFKATTYNSPLRRWLGPTIPRHIVGICSGLQIVICSVWLHTSPPFPALNTQIENQKIIFECNEGQKLFFYMTLGFLGFLAMISFFVAFLARNLPGTYNEAKLITFSMLVFCCVWISFIPAYLSTSGKYTVAVQVFAILASSAGLLSCIFLPKCYILLLRPDRNRRECFGSNTSFGHGSF